MSRKVPEDKPVMITNICKEKNDGIKEILGVKIRMRMRT